MANGVESVGCGFAVHLLWVVYVGLNGVAVVHQFTEIDIPGAAFAPAVLDSTQRAACATACLTIATFVAGPENQLVAAATQRWLPERATRCGSASERLFIWGVSGTGKTHLLAGLCRRWQASHGHESAEYLTASQFREELVEAFKANQVPELRRRLRSRKLLAIDEIHRLPANHYLNEELVHMLDAFQQTGGRLLLASGEPPRSLAHFSPALVDRLMAGYTLALSAPGLTARRELVRRIAGSLGHVLSADVVELVGRLVPGTANDLAGAIVDLVYGPYAPAQLDANQVRKFLSNRIDRRQPSIQDIVRVVARYYSIPQKVLKSSSRRQSVAFARAMVVYLARRLTGMSFHLLGKSLSGRDHTTMIHSFRKIDQLAQHDIATQQAINELQRLLTVA
jgi:chromosomal replication initiator protein